jgi:hypothetical protein
MNPEIAKTSRICSPTLLKPGRPGPVYIPANMKIPRGKGRTFMSEMFEIIYTRI